MVATDSFQRIEIKKSEELREWLMNNYAQEESVWLVSYKKRYGSNYVSNSEVLDELLVSKGNLMLIGPCS